MFARRLFFSLFVAATSISAGPPPQPVKNLIVFGDSYSGKNYAIGIIP